MMVYGLKQVSMNNFLNKFKLLFLALFSFVLVGCNEPSEAELHPERTYIGDANYSIMSNSEKVAFGDYDNLEVVYQQFPQYFVNKAKEWPKEDLNDASSYDMPRFQFAWANTLNKEDEYESGIKIWSMKTDGTDLRLVTDATINLTSVSGLARSPNNRYVSWAGSGGFKRIYDLQTGELTDYLMKATSPPTMVWSQDSRYLYFERLRDRYARWDSETKEISKVDFKFPNESYIKDDVIVRLTNTAAVSYNILTNEKLFILRVDRDLPAKKRRFNIRSLSPDGRHAWGNNSDFGFLFDIEKQTVTQMKDGFAPAQILGKDARYSGLSNLSHVTVVDRMNDKVWRWSAFYDGHLSGKAILYNGLANDGLWFKNK